MSTNSRSNSRANFSNEIHDIGAARSTTPSMYYNEKSIADYFPPHLLKKVRQMQIAYIQLWLLRLMITLSIVDQLG
jgi:hypothetical protein